MEGKFFQKTTISIHEDADMLNDETFGLDIGNLNDDWEQNHEKLSKLLELEHEEVKKSSPLRIQQKGFQSEHHNRYSNVPRCNNLNSEDDDEEEVIIESSISQLGLDDDDDDADNSLRHSGLSYEFKESMESWMSPSRGRDSHTDSLKELISPGDGVWASPSRDQIVPDYFQNERKEQEGNILKKLFGGHNIVTAKKSNEKSPAPQAINVEDLEKGLRREGENFPQPTIIERHLTPTPPMMPVPQLSPFTTPPPPGFMPRMEGEIPRMPLPPMGMPQLIHPHISPLLLMNQQLKHGVLPKGMIGKMPLLSPKGVIGQMPLLPPNFFARPPFPNQRDGRPDHTVFRSGGGYEWHGNRGRGRYRQNNHNRSWSHTDSRPGNRRPPPEPPLVEMEPSKMMTSKEKEWIFKISIMSLLSGDFYASDFYFINYMNKKLLEKTSPRRDTDKQKEEKEKAKNLVSYAQKHQQTKESHKPVKFEGSLGKLSITSVHHPRQIMDFSTPEHETQTISRVQEGRRKKYAMYGLVEKMYDVFLSISDIESELLETPPDEQVKVLKKRAERIDELFELFRVNVHTSTSEDSDTDYFLHMMSICKARRLLERSLIIFKTEQSESLLVSIIHVLPALLKKDNKDKSAPSSPFHPGLMKRQEKALRYLPEKVEIVLSKSCEKFKVRCLQMLRKINLKMLLTYQMSIGLLAVVLDSLTDKNPEHNIEWSYYFCEVSKLSIELPPDVFERNCDDIQKLKTILGADDILININ